MKERELYSPIALNEKLKRLFAERVWKKRRIQVTTYFPEINEEHKGFREKV